MKGEVEIEFKGEFLKVSKPLSDRKDTFVGLWKVNKDISEIRVVVRIFCRGQWELMDKEYVDKLSFG